MTNTSRSIIAVIRQSPYGSSLARSALDIVLAAGAFEQSISVLLCGDGVLQLVPQQNGAALGTKTLSKQLASLPLYDIENVYAEAESIDRYNIDISLAPIPVEARASADIQSLLAQHDHVIGL